MAHPSTPDSPPAPLRRLPVVDLRASLEPLTPALSAAATRVITGARFILGPEVAAFETEVAEFLGGTHAVGVSSGTDALFLALAALGVGPGDEVLVPAFGFVATAEAVVRTGAEPRFVDVRPGCGRMDLDAADRAWTTRTRALIHVPLGGHAAGTAEAARFASAHGVRLVEDAAQSFGAADQGRAVGTHGDVGTFSFFPAKILGGFGDGGLVVTRDGDVAERVRSLRQHGRDSTGRFVHAGANARLDELQAALLRVRLAALPAELEARRILAHAYTDSLVSRGLASPPECACTGEGHGARHALVLPPACTALHGLYTVLVPDRATREGLQQHLSDSGIDTAVYYARLVADEPRFSPLASRTSGAPLADAFPGARLRSARALTLPFFPGMDPGADVTRVAESLAAFFAQEGGPWPAPAGRGR